MKKSVIPVSFAADPVDDARLAGALDRIADELEALVEQIRSRREAVQ